MPRTSKTAAGRKAFPTANPLYNPLYNADASVAVMAPPPAAVMTAASKPSSSGKQPKTVLDKIVYAIRQQPSAKTPKGVSRQTISKYLKSELDYDNAAAIKTALKKGVDKDVLEKNGQSFRVKGDPIAKAVDEGPKLEIVDVTTDDGNNNNSNGGEMVAQSGDLVTMKYVGQLDDGHVFEKSSLTFTLGAGDVIKGWDQGIPGMRIGGRRKLTVPSKLGYGKRGSAPDIPGDATLHFDVTLTSINRPE